MTLSPALSASLSPVSVESSSHASFLPFRSWPLCVAACHCCYALCALPAPTGWKPKASDRVSGTSATGKPQNRRTSARAMTKVWRRDALLPVCRVDTPQADFPSILTIVYCYWC